MIEVTKHGVILEKTDAGFENEAVLNPAVQQEGDNIHLFYRAVSKGNYSSIGYSKLKGPLKVEERFDAPVIFPQLEYESHGIEDPRITEIEGLYYLTYTAYDGVNALGTLATSKDLEHFEKYGIIVPQITYDVFSHFVGFKGAINGKYERYNNRNNLLTVPDKTILVWDKNLIFFPRRINKKLYFLHRIKPDIQIVSVNELAELTTDFWEQYLINIRDNIALVSKYEHEASYLGGGCPPVETEAGWLLIYHGVQDTPKGYVYAACAALMELDNPLKEIARLPYPLFKPEHQWELKGEVNNVCFPTGTALFDDTLYIYYGAADERIACASVNLPALIAELLLNKIKK
ncbi:MAG: pesticidal protein Cry7Aa [Bacteroidota bacterium]|uniref:glycoside hydrolase family 130 protein n=1 Tax=Runella sp. TaxID=1960881 RepID=UPI003017F037